MRSHEELNKVFQSIEDAKEKHGGKAWKDFVDSIPYAEFRRQIANMPLAEAQELLDYFVRWQRALEKAAPPAVPVEESRP